MDVRHWFQRLLKPRRASVAVVPSAEVRVSADPDLPRAFGYKVGWFAVSTSDAALVARVLGLEGTQDANWETGLNAVYASSLAPKESGCRVFLTPPLDGWVLVVGTALPYPVDADGANPELQKMANEFGNLLLRLASHFDDVQHFGNHRVSDFVTWTRRTPRSNRSFTYGDGCVYCNREAQTNTERELGFADLSGLASADAVQVLFRLLGEQQEKHESLRKSGLTFQEASKRVGRSPMPDETDVTDLAAAWSIDPTLIEERFREKSAGTLGLLRLDL